METRPKRDRKPTSKTLPKELLKKVSFASNKRARVDIEPKAIFPPILVESSSSKSPLKKGLFKLKPPPPL